MKTKFATLALLVMLSMFNVNCSWFAPLGEWTVKARHYESDCVDLLKTQTYPSEATALVHPRVIRLGECAVPLTEDGKLESSTMCWGPGGDQMAFHKGRYNRFAKTLELTGKIYKTEEEGTKTCPVKFVVEFKDQAYVALDPLAPITHAAQLRAQTPR